MTTKLATNENRSSWLGLSIAQNQGRNNLLLLILIDMTSYPNV